MKERKQKLSSGTEAKFMPVKISKVLQVKIANKGDEVKSEHHKASGSSSANARRIQAANLPCHRQIPRVMTMCKPVKGII
jgi:hypothetical protein